MSMRPFQSDIIRECFALRHAGLEQHLPALDGRLLEAYLERIPRFAHLFQICCEVQVFAVKEFPPEACYAVLGKLDGYCVAGRCFDTLQLGSEVCATAILGL